MSLINDYSVHILAAQQQRELRAEAENDRLVRLARGDRLPWWNPLVAMARRIRISHIRTGRRTPPSLVPPAHRVAH